jgi:hypothetical protein
MTTAYRDPKTSERFAVLRPSSPTLSLRRLAEWNVLMDKVGDAVSPEQGRAHKLGAEDLWITMKKEQQWTFLGWLSADTKSVLDDQGNLVGEAAPGDLHEKESAMKGWR